MLAGGSDLLYSGLLSGPGRLLDDRNLGGLLNRVKSRHQNGIRHIHEIHWGKCLCGGMGRGWRRLGEVVLTPEKKTRWLELGVAGEEE